MNRRIKKILLINPPYYVSSKKVNFWPSFPLGMGYIASFLEKRGYLVKIIDAFAEGYENRVSHGDKYLRIGLSDEQILTGIADFSPDLVGVSCLFSIQHFALHSMVKTIKNFNKDLPVVVGGPHVSGVPELVMSDKNIDFGVLGEGEEKIMALIDALNNGTDLKKIPGIAYREGDEVRINKSSVFVKDLDEIPFPAWHLFKMDRYLNQEISHGGLVRRRPFMTMLTSRGCPMRCFFCSVRDTWGTNIRTRSPGNVIKEIMTLREKFQIKELIIVDDNFNFDIERLDAILDFLIKEKMDLVVEVPNGLFLKKLNKGILNKMQKAGFCKIYFPIESGNEHVRNAIIKKPVDMNLVRELVSYCRLIGLEAEGYFIFGLPGETKSQMRDTFKLIRELKIQSYFSVATPFPGSDMYKYAGEKGLLKSYDINSCSDEYNITTREWRAEELAKTLKWEKFKLTFKSRAFSAIKDPSKLFKKIAEFIN